MGFKEELLDFKRSALQANLLKLTEAQLAKFNMIFPKGVPDDKIESAIDLIERTLRFQENARV